jgi:hypothetical protein
METFDEIAERYDKKPVAFLLEGILQGWYECVISDECGTCELWDKISGGKLRHITRKNHAKDGRLPRPHRFSPATGFYRLSAMSKEQVLHHVKRLRRSSRRPDEADLLGLYCREKFEKRSRAGVLTG